MNEIKITIEEKNYLSKPCFKDQSCEGCSLLNENPEEHLANISEKCKNIHKLLGNTVCFDNNCIFVEEI